MIDISFVNLILIIADNASDSGEPGNPYSSTPDAPDSPHPSATVMPGNSCSSASVIFNRFCPSTFVEFSNPSNSILDPLTNIIANPFGDFSMDAFSDLIIALTPSFAVPSLSKLLVFGRFLQDNFLALAVDAFSTLSWDVLPDHPFSAGHLLPPLLPPPSNSTTPNHPPSPGCPLLLLLPPLGNSTAFSALAHNISLNHPSSPGPLPPLFLFFSNSTVFFVFDQDVPLDHTPSPGLLLFLLCLGNSTYD